MTRRRLLLDTDLGTDVDDALALALLLGSPEVELLGITTTYGDTALRARETSALLRLAGAPRPPVRPVLAGAEEPLSGAPVWWSGQEGTLLGDLSAEPVTAVGAPTDAADWIAAQVAAAPGEVDVLAIGPLTNIALAVQRSPGFARDVRRLWVMGGRWDGALDERGALEAEHNLRSDALAARTVLASGAATTVVGLDVTRRVPLLAEDLARWQERGPLGAHLAERARAWWAFWDEEQGVPHDPVAALALLAPDALRLGPRGRVDVDDRGAVTHVPDPTGSVRVATGVDVDAARGEVVRRVLVGAGPRAPLEGGEPPAADHLGSPRA